MKGEEVLASVPAPQRGAGVCEQHGMPRRKTGGGAEQRTGSVKGACRTNPFNKWAALESWESGALPECRMKGQRAVKHETDRKQGG